MACFGQAYQAGCDDPQCLKRFGRRLSHFDEGSPPKTSGQRTRAWARQLGDAPTCGVASVPGYRAVQVKTNDDGGLPLPTNPKLVDPPAGTDAL